MRAEEVAGLDELPSLPLNMATSLARSHCSKSPRSESIVPGADVTISLLVYAGKSEAAIDLRGCHS